jgi:hypothetical protein
MTGRIPEVGAGLEIRPYWTSSRPYLLFWPVLGKRMRVKLAKLLPADVLPAA